MLLHYFLMLFMFFMFVKNFVYISHLTFLALYAALVISHTFSSRPKSRTLYSYCENWVSGGFPNPVLTLLSCSGQI